MIPAPQQFTATQIARAIGKQRQSVQRQLAGVAPSGTVIVSGNAAAAWKLSDLPLAMQGELKARATQNGCRDAEHLLNAPATLWKSPVPLSNVAQHCIDKAAKLQRALRRVLAS